VRVRRHRAAPQEQFVASTFRDHFNIDLRVVDAEKEFLGDLAGVIEPQEKRKRIGHRFIEVFKHATKDDPELRNAAFLAQGTLYPDVIESGHALSGGPSGAAAGIKLHHNVGGLPEEIGFELIEPLRELFKDEVCPRNSSGGTRSPARGWRCGSSVR
jgi:GMP synthase (glutamine-hydrolysing)